jgi:hypothetical protein
VNHPRAGKGHSLTVAESEAAKTHVVIARGKLAVAKGNVQNTESMLKYARVVAPFSGIITKRSLTRELTFPFSTSMLLLETPVHPFTHL